MPPSTVSPRENDLLHFSLVCPLHPFGFALHFHQHSALSGLLGTQRCQSCESQDITIGISAGFGARILTFCLNSSCHDLPALGAASCKAWVLGLSCTELSCPGTLPLPATDQAPGSLLGWVRAQVLQPLWTCLSTHGLC